MRRSASSWKRRRARRKRRGGAFGSRTRRSPCGGCAVSCRQPLRAARALGWHRSMFSRLSTPAQKIGLVADLGAGRRARACGAGVGSTYQNSIHPTRWQLRAKRPGGSGQGDARPRTRGLHPASGAAHERVRICCGISHGAPARTRRQDGARHAAALDRARRRRTFRPDACPRAAAGFRGRPGSAWTACRSAAHRHRRR